MMDLFWKEVAAASTLGFLAGFVGGMFLGIWTWATLAGVM